MKSIYLAVRKGYEWEDPLKAFEKLGDAETFVKKCETEGTGHWLDSESSFKVKEIPFDHSNQDHPLTAAVQRARGGGTAPEHRGFA